MTKPKMPPVQEAERRFEDAYVVIAQFACWRMMQRNICFNNMPEKYVLCIRNITVILFMYVPNV